MSDEKLRECMKIDHQGYYDGFHYFVGRSPFWEDTEINRTCNVGRWNGYVLLPIGHKFYGLEYDNIKIDAHGGLTFSREVKAETSFLWIETKEDFWVIGFDTAHWGDKRDFWTIKEVTKECKRIIDQL